jgi:predicted nucleic acid-binding protein
MRAFLDTNVLIYSVSTLPEERPRRDRARGLLASADWAISVQVLQEFIRQSTRASRTGALSLDQALEFVSVWRAFPVQETTLNLLDQGVELLRRHRFSFWDAMIVAAAIAQGCEILYTEDMQHGRIVEGTHIVDPFR